MKNNEQEYLNLLRSGLALRKADYEHRKSMKNIEKAINEMLGDTLHE